MACQRPEHFDKKEIERIRERKDALTKTIAEKGAKSHCTYKVSKRIIRYFPEETIKHTRELNGTPYQQQLHKELLTLAKISSHYQEELDADDTNDGLAGKEATVELLHDCITTRMSLNQEHHDAQATMMADICWGVVDAVPQVALGIATRAIPGVTLVSGAFFAYNLAMIIHSEFSQDEDNTDPDHGTLYGAAKKLYRALKKVTARDIAREVTEFGINRGIAKGALNPIKRWIKKGYKKLKNSSLAQQAHDNIKACAESIAEQTGFDGLAVWQTAKMYKELCVARGKEFIARSKEILAEIKNACSSAKETCAFKGKRPDKKPSKKELEKAAKKNPTPDKTPEPLTPAQQFEASIFRLPPEQRVPVIREKAQEVALKNGFVEAKDNILRKNPGRIIYYDEPARTFYSVDTQHGRFEVQNKKGKHLREVNFDLEKTKDALDGHDINV